MKTEKNDQLRLLRFLRGMHIAIQIFRHLKQFSTVLSIFSQQGIWI